MKRYTYEEAVERQNIIKGLEHCVSHESEKACFGCPYAPQCYEGEYDFIKEDALKFMKPRKLTIEEIPNHQVVFFLNLDSGYECYSIVTAATHDGVFLHDGAEERKWNYKDYGIKHPDDVDDEGWVCWNIEPTMEQIKEISRNVQEKE